MAGDPTAVSDFSLIALYCVLSASLCTRGALTHGIVPGAKGSEPYEYCTREKVRKSDAYGAIRQNPVFARNTIVCPFPEMPGIRFVDADKKTT